MTRRYLYNYQTTVTFSAPVVGHAVLLRCLPVMGEYIGIDDEHLLLPPGYRMHRGRDAFGNRIVYGIRRDAHLSLAYVSTGVVSMAPYAVGPDRVPMPLWLLPSGLTVLPDPAASGPRDVVAEGAGRSPADAAAEICHAVNSMICYAAGCTTVETTAAEVLAGGRGVCQDYAHVMVALCRRAGIPARYVCGILAGTGQTHAWVEVFDGYSWRGYDPTHDVCIDYGYMKIAHGRDAADCPVSRGIYGGGAEQQMQVSVTMVEV